MTVRAVARVLACLVVLQGSTLFSAASAQDTGTKAGPVIDAFGAVYPVPDPDFATPTGDIYRVVFEVGQTAEAPDAANMRINTLARFLNMHAQAGVPLERMELALVLHGPAGKDALANAAYRARFGTENPNLELLTALDEAGVQIYLCGQTAAARGLPRDELARPVQMALSAMTVLVALQATGYQLIAF
jgi:intracellular sulfur oxidation DsrE/DsrF family protein